MKDKHYLAMGLRAAYLTMHRQTNLCLAPFGITADQFVCLVILYNSKGLTQQAIVQEASSDPNTIRAMLVLLEKRGLVVRHPHPTDRRARLVQLTQEGHDILKDLLQTLEPVHEKLESIFQHVDSDTFMTGLTLITESMQSLK